MFSSITNDPNSSWGYHNETTTNASGITFAVKFVGYVPVFESISESSPEVKDKVVKLCVNTVVTSQLSKEFSDALQRKTLGEFVSVHDLEVFLNVANFTITFFHNQDNKTFLLGRYMNNRISHYKTVVIDDEYYLGIVMVNRAEEKRECNVIKLRNKTAHDELIEKLKSVDNPERLPASELHSRLKSTQSYNFRIPMLSCYHGSITARETCNRLKNPGDFLCRDSQSTRGLFTITFLDNNRTYCSQQIEPNHQFAKIYQGNKTPLKNAVLRPRY